VLLRDRERRFSLPLTLYEDAERFLARLDHAQKLLGGGPGVAGGKRPAGGGQGERGIGFHSISVHPSREMDNAMGGTRFGNNKSPPFPPWVPSSPTIAVAIGEPLR